LAQKLKIARPWLHAKQLAFTHPASGERISFSSEYPEDLTRSLALLSDLAQ
jgi:23S rRNA pseudouridine1911/1915/1917 synthase